MTANVTLGRWQIGARLGRGGNGSVHVASSGELTAAIKLLTRPDRVGRFRDEVEGMRRLSGTLGVLPVLDSSVPINPTKSDPAWFVMPLATPLQEALGPTPDPFIVVEAIRDIASVLASVHQKKFSHRDVKPDNLFKYGAYWSVGDFGLVEFDGKTHKTTIGERIGPMHFIAPEMLLGLTGADGRAADVYSIAKTLWVLLSGTNYPVPGTYSATSPICQLKSYVVIDQSTLLDQLIQQCTATDPVARPSMDLVRMELTAWLGLKNDNHNVSIADTTLPLHGQWSEVIEVGQAQDLERNIQAKRHTDMQNAINSLYARVMPLHEELKTIFQSARLKDIDGPNTSTSPPGVIASFPMRSTLERRVALEYRVWFTTDWSQLDSNKIAAVGIARLVVNPPTESLPTELYRHAESFLLDGPGQEACLARLRNDALSCITSWLESGRQKWIEVG